jgi:hypothetical protein
MSPDHELKVWHPESIWLLGMWQASWPRKPDEELLEGVSLPKTVKVSVGIGIVVPAPFIAEVLQSKEMREQHAEAKLNRDSDEAATTDMPPPTH